MVKDRSCGQKDLSARSTEPQSSGDYFVMLQRTSSRTQRTSGMAREWGSVSSRCIFKFCFVCAGFLPGGLSSQVSAGLASYLAPNLTKRGRKYFSSQQFEHQGLRSFSTWFTLATDSDGNQLLCPEEKERFETESVLLQS